MLTNNWYVAGESSELTNRPKRVKMLGQYFVLFRDEQGRAACLHDVCIHRGGSLGGHGKVVNGNVECPYHGWRYNREGACTLIPALGPGKAISKKARVDAYPVREKYGFVWVFLGDLDEAERPPLPEYPEYDDANWRCIRGRFFWRANYTRVVENGIDPAHAAFVHAGLFGNTQDPRIPPVHVTTEAFGAGTTLEMERPPVKGIWRYLRKETEKPCIRVQVGFHLSGMCVMLRQELSPKIHMALFDVNTPVDEDHTQTYWILARDFARVGVLDFDTHRRNLMVFEQDRRIVEHIQPELAPRLDEEVSVKSDKMQIAFRDMHQERLDRGWGIDQQRIEAARNQHAYVIPSPGRKQQENHWTLPVVPLVQAGSRRNNGAPEAPSEH